MAGVIVGKINLPIFTIEMCPAYLVEAGSIAFQSTNLLGNIMRKIYKKLLTLAALVVMALMPLLAYSAIGAGHVSGKITNITSISSGLLIRIESNEVPESCTSGYVWMEIKQEKVAMTSLTITAWTLGRNVSVYTSPATSGYCQVTQVDPVEL